MTYTQGIETPLKPKPVNKFQFICSNYLSCFTLITLWVGVELGGLWHGATTLWFFIVVPLFDYFMKNDLDNFDSNRLSNTETILLQLAPMGYIFGHVIFFFVYATIAPELSTSELMLASLSLGVSATANIGAAHELIHKRNAISKTIARLGLLMVGYMHFEYFHLLCHHKIACTKDDFNAARKGHSAYQHLVRSFRGSIPFCWNHEVARLKNNNLNSINIHNKVLWFAFLPTLLLILITAIFGVQAAILFVSQAIISVVTLETVSYIQHYGLERSTLNSGRYEKTSLAHSWDSYNKISNLATFMIGRHSNHHMDPRRDFYKLESNTASPQLPYGYTVMVVSAFIPPLWRLLMDSRVKSVLQKT
ncbi:MAG: alkane 1-monooxygenase [Pseudomonadales bacterium]|nr:alkane 1-monooxygenase [Pseudomonadales bacterium]